MHMKVAEVQRVLRASAWSWLNSWEFRADLCTFGRKGQLTSVWFYTWNGKNIAFCGILRRAFSSTSVGRACAVRLFKYISSNSPENKF